MKNSILFCILLCYCLTTKAQFTSPVDSGGGHFIEGPMDDISPMMREQIQKSLDRAIDSLKPHSRNPNLQLLFTVSFSWPIKLVAGVNDSGFYGISNFIDRNPAFPNQLQDYNCGSRTYDLSSGYNHAGTDIFTYPFPWYKMDNNQVEIISAAPGTIILKSDGNFDRNCGFNNNNWNAVYIQHSDGTVAWYGHMKNGSLTSKTVGQTVVAGEYLGIVGSSGSSTGPHLHFEVHDNLGNILDPWNGPCNVSASLWASQQPYYNSRLNKHMICSAPPVEPTCPGQETLNQTNNLCGGNTFYAYASYRDQQIGQSVTYKLIQPNSVVWQQWTQNFTTFYSASWWYYSWILPTTPLAGVWKYQVIYLGVTYETSFNVNTNAASSVSILANPSGPICNLTNVTFTATPINGGTPTYQWLYNNGNVGTNSSTYSNNNLANMSTVKCIMTSNRTCVSGSPATSGTTTMTVNPNVSAGVSISSNIASPICTGTNVTFTASGTNPGTTPSYIWKKGNSTVGSGTSYVTNSLANNDTISCILTSNATCVTGSPVTSNKLPMIVKPFLPVSVLVGTSTSGPVCSGTNITLTATPSNGGTTPVYLWKKNNVTVGSNSNIYNATSVSNADQFYCTLTSNEQCKTGSPATSNLTTVSASRCTVSLNIRTFIESFYFPGTDSMRAVINPSVFPTICDTVSVLLADSVSKQIVASSINIIDTHGYGTFNFSGLLPQHKYYLVLRYRNGIETWSKYPYLFMNAALGIDFTRP